MIATIKTCTDSAYRKSSGGNVRAVRELSRRLADAVKDRSANHLIASAALHPKLEAARRKMAGLTPSARLELMFDQELPLTVRATAAWFASGLEWDREKRILGSDVAGLAGAYVELGVPSELVSAVMLAARTREPLAVLVPLIWLTTQDTSTRVEACFLPRTAQIESVPLYAFDTHTRIGRLALDRFARENIPIRELLARYTPGRSGSDAIRAAAFHAESACVLRQLRWPLGQRIEALGVEADLLQAGAIGEGHEALLQAVRDNIDHLNELRSQVFLQSRTQTRAQAGI